MASTCLIDVTKLCDIEVDGIDRKDHPDYCDAYLSDAWIEIESLEGQPENCVWEYCSSTKKMHRQLNDAELDWLNENEPDFVYSQVEKSLY